MKDIARLAEELAHKVMWKRPEKAESIIREAITEAIEPYKTRLSEIYSRVRESMNCDGHQVCKNCEYKDECAGAAALLEG